MSATVSLRLKHRIDVLIADEGAQGIQNVPSVLYQTLREDKVHSQSDSSQSYAGQALGIRTRNDCPSHSVKHEGITLRSSADEKQLLAHGCFVVQRDWLESCPLPRSRAKNVCCQS